MSSFSHYRVRNEHQIPELAKAGQKDDDEPTANLPDSVRSQLQIEITSLTESDIEFDLIGADTSIANALRRIMLAEVPTIAIENVWIAVNSSIIQDEVLAHRVGLIPIKADPSKLDYATGEDGTDRDTIVFHFDVECSIDLSSSGLSNSSSKGAIGTEHGSAAAPGTTKGATNNAKLKLINENALSGALEWHPQGGQMDMFPEGVGPVHDDIVVAQLRPGQRIEFEAHCRKGVGKDHAKYSPVATATYRLMPEIIMPEPVTGQLAQQLKSMCPMNVFDIEDLPLLDSAAKGTGAGTGKDGKRRGKTAAAATGSGETAPTAVVARPRDCTMCRECIRHKGWEERVQLKRRANHFLFSVEATGCMAPETIVKEACNVLKEKAQKFQQLVEEQEQEQQL